MVVWTGESKKQYSKFKYRTLYSITYFYHPMCELTMYLYITSYFSVVDLKLFKPIKPVLNF